MERIKKAIELARAEQSAANASAAQGQTLAVPEPDPKPPRPAVAKEAIHYSSTRIASVSKAVLSRNRIVLGDTDDEAATAYKILRTQVEHRLAARDWNVLAITSPGVNQGKTLTSINLSVALAREMHRTVLLVDLDLRNPCVDRYFELDAPQGLADYLLDDVPLPDLLVNPGIERLVVLPAGRSVQASSELVASPKMLSLVEELKARYPSRIIVFDMPPLLAADDTLAFAPYVDAALLVVEDAKTTRDDLARSLELLEGVQLLGTVLNKANENQPTYSYRES